MALPTFSGHIQAHVSMSDTQSLKGICCNACRWRSYFTSGSSAVYLFLYSAFYFYTKLDITKVCLPLLCICTLNSRQSPRSQMHI